MKAALGSIAVVITLLSFVPYFRDIAAGRTRPHVISWFVWSMLTFVAFIAQVVGGGGSGSWATGVTAALLASIFILALRKGERTINRTDWACIAGVAGAAILWVITSDPLIAVVLITVIDVLGAIPTFRKSYTKPYEETLSTYALWSVKIIFSLLALKRVSAVTALYPTCMLVMDTLFVLFLLQRRRSIDSKVS